ncbi:MAG: Holliday junction branch migration protein RuvA [Clostridiales bacterium]|nr:Holliday junction branch migration protein RuvA [Clostridiales bacterium]MDY2901257.1 Holliday junction branch migration protein RuvA [Christensenellaceae bacterium]
MIAFIKGKVIDEFEGGVVLENNGIGYEILCSAALLAKLSAEKEGGVFTYLQVREDGLSLFGFDNKEEKRMFLKLISVSGIGPKMAMGILSGMRVNELATAIAMNDVKGLSRIKGLGKKTAERIILELRESVSAENAAIAAEESFAAPVFTSEDEDAIIALMGLGFSGIQSRNAVKTAKEQGAETIQDVISFALKSMGK